MKDEELKIQGGFYSRPLVAQALDGQISLSFETIGTAVEINLTPDQAALLGAFLMRKAAEAGERVR